MTLIEWPMQSFLLLTLRLLPGCFWLLRRRLAYDRP
nr:MAG TPA: hypothetical protein [Caudoviricetes sp.]